MAPHETPNRPDIHASDGTAMSGTLSPVREPPSWRGARLLQQRLETGGISPRELAGWLLPRGFPARPRQDGPHDAILWAIGAVREIGHDPWPVRQGLAEALARLLDEKPEATDDWGPRDYLLGELYELARTIEMPPMLARPLADALKRGIPDEVKGVHGSPRRDLLNAAIVNQIDTSLLDTFLTMLRFPYGDAKGDMVRNDWGASWRDGWAGIREMEAGPGTGRPNIAALEAALCPLNLWLEAEAEEECPIEADDCKRRRWIQSEQLTRLDGVYSTVQKRWPSDVDGQYIFNILVKRLHELSPPDGVGNSHWVQSVVTRVKERVHSLNTNGYELAQYRGQNIFDLLRRLVGEAPLRSQPWLYFMNGIATYFPDDSSAPDPLPEGMPVPPQVGRASVNLMRVLEYAGC